MAIAAEDYASLMQAIDASAQQKSILDRLHADYLEAYSQVAAGGRTFQIEADRDLTAKREATLAAELSPETAMVRRHELRSEFEKAHVAMLRELGKWASQLAEIDREFVEGISDVLHDDQYPRLAGWLAERRWHDYKRISRSTPLASLDLLQVVDSLGLSESQKDGLKPLLAIYKQSMDDLIAQAAEREIRNAREDWREIDALYEMNSSLRADPGIYAGHTPDFAKIDVIGKRYSRKTQALRREQLAVEQLVRICNQTYIDAIMERLPEETLEEFRKLVLIGGYPVHCVPYFAVHRYGAAISKLDDLGADQKDRIDEILLEADRHLIRFNEQSASMYDRFFHIRMNQAAMTDATLKVNQALKDLEQERRRTDHKLAERLHGVLTQEQQFKAPLPKQRYPDEPSNVAPE